MLEGFSFKKILKVIRYSSLSILLLVFAIARIPFGSDKEAEGGDTAFDFDDLGASKAFADSPRGGSSGDDGSGDDDDDGSGGDDDGGK